MHLSKKERASFSCLPAVLKDATRSFRGKAAGPLEYVYRVHLFKKDSEFSARFCSAQERHAVFRGKPARPLEYVYQAKLTEWIPQRTP